MKKLSFALTALATFTAGSVMAQTANTASGTVEIRGKVVNQTCEVSGAYKNLVVILDTVGLKKLSEKNGVDGVKPFFIKLNNCKTEAVDGISSVFASFSTSSLDDIYNLDGTGVLENKAPEDRKAKNIGVQILNADDSVVNLNPETLLKSADAATVGAGVAGPYGADANEVKFGVLRGLTFDNDNQGKTYADAARAAATDTTAATDVLGKKVAGGETWVAGTALTNKGAKLGATDITLEYKAQYIALDVGAEAGDVEAFVSYNIAYK